MMTCPVNAQDAQIIKVSENDEPMQKGKFEPNWESLKTYETPEWFRNAKFGIWAHWGPQCVEGSGDWMARSLYIEGSSQYKYHVAHYGHPTEVGFKDILPLFKAERWNPDSLVAYYKSLGAQYFFALGNHHDNFDLSCICSSSLTAQIDVSGGNCRKNSFMRLLTNILPKYNTKSGRYSFGNFLHNNSSK